MNAIHPTSETQQVSHQEFANAIRALSMDAVEAAKSGHPGMPMGMADVATVLFQKFLKFDASHPDWPNRDRFILSAGHGSMLLYSLLYLTGYPELTLDQIKAFRQWGSLTAGHPEFGLAKGIETTTGPLGQGLANGVGMAMGERLLSARFGDTLVDHRTYVIVGDGCLMEGISHEAISLAGHLRLRKLIVLFDDNGISIDGPTSLTTSEDHTTRFQASGWKVLAADGHDPVSIERALIEAQGSDRPVMIACKTVIGYGAPKKAGTASVHGSPLGSDEAAAAKAKLGWTEPPFVIPDRILKAWRQAGCRHAGSFAKWEAQLRDHPKASEFHNWLDREIPAAVFKAIETVKADAHTARPKIATRQSSQSVLDAVSPHLPQLIGGSADLTGSNNTRSKDMSSVTADNFQGRYIYYGVREHAMAAIMNGMSLHGGLIPYGGTFLVFSDYCRPAIRLSALMHQPVIYIMTHDSIALGEDGPTHQPIEHLSSLRVIPNLLVMRPADTIETAECWEIALRQTDRPSLLALSRQALPSLARGAVAGNACQQGGYVLSPAQGQQRVTLIATGSEVSLAIEVQRILTQDGIGAAVVSLPCWRLFDAQPSSYRNEVMGDPERVLRVSIEAAACFGWERYVGPNGLMLGIDHFGASAPAEKLYQEFGLTPDKIVAAVKARL